MAPPCGRKGPLNLRDPSSRMLKKPASFVLASFRPSTYPRGYASVLHSLRPCWTAFLSILRGILPLPKTRGPMNFHRATIVFPQPARGSTLAYDRAVSVCRLGLTAPRAGLIPFAVIGPMAPCACASLFVMMSGSVIFPQMRHSHPSYCQAWSPSKCAATLNPPHRSQVIGSSIGDSEQVRVTAGLRAHYA